MSHKHNDSEQSRLLEKILHEQRRTVQLLECVLALLVPPPIDPTGITFKETNVALTLPDAGNTLVFTGTLQPAGAVLPASASPTLTASDTTWTASLDSTGLIATVVIPTTASVGETVTFDWASGTYTPANPGSPTSITGSFSITVGTPPVTVIDPTGITFPQTA